MFEVRAEVESEPNSDIATEINTHLKTLFQQTGPFNEKIEREIKKHLPSYVSVQSSIEFEEGSLIVSGTVALLGVVQLFSTRQKRKLRNSFRDL